MSYKHYLKEIFDTFEQAEMAAAIKSCKSKPIVAAIYGQFPDLQEVVIHHVGTIGEEETPPDNSTISGEDDASQTK